MAEYKVSIHIDLGSFKGGLQRALQRATDMVAFGLWAAENAPPTDDHGVPGAFFQVSPAENIRLDFDGKKQAFPGWVLANGLRDCIEAAHTFLEEARRVCSVWVAFNGRSRMTGIEWNEWQRKEEAEALAFHRKGLPDKFDALAKHSATLVTPLKGHVLAINRTRNCLVHRYGIVTKLDTDSPDGFLVRWLKMEVIVRGLEGERVIGPGEIVHGGETLMIRQTETSKLFRLGDRVLFTAQDFNDICMTLLRFCEALTALVEEFGKSKGVKFTTPLAGAPPQGAESADTPDNPPSEAPRYEASEDRSE